jgi:hypothetical protein
MSMSRFEVTFHIPLKPNPDYVPGSEHQMPWLNHEEIGTTYIDVPDYVLDEDADRGLETDEDQSPLVIFLTEQLHSSIGSHAELEGFTLHEQEI